MFFLEINIPPPSNMAPLNRSGFGLANDAFEGPRRKPHSNVPLISTVFSCPPPIFRGVSSPPPPSLCHSPQVFWVGTGGLLAPCPPWTSWAGSPGNRPLWSGKGSWQSCHGLPFWQRTFKAQTPPNPESSLPSVSLNSLNAGFEGPRS